MPEKWETEISLFKGIKHFHLFYNTPKNSRPLISHLQKFNAAYSHPKYFTMYSSFDRSDFIESYLLREL